MAAQRENTVITKPRAYFLMRRRPPRERPEQQEPGLRDDSDRAPTIAQTGPYKESAVNLRIAEVTQLLARLRPARRSGMGSLPKWEAHIQMLEQRIQALNRARSDARAELLICRQSRWIHLKQLQIEYIAESRIFQRHRPHIIAEIHEVNRIFGRLLEEAERSAEVAHRNQFKLIAQHHAEIEQLAEDIIHNCVNLEIQCHAIRTDYRAGMKRLAEKIRLYYLDVMRQYHTETKRVSRLIRAERLSVLMQYSTEIKQVSELIRRERLDLINHFGAEVKRISKAIRRERLELIIHFSAEIKRVIEVIRQNRLDLMMQYDAEIRRVTEVVRLRRLDLIMQYHAKISQSTENVRLDLHDLDFGLCDPIQLLRRRLELELAIINNRIDRKEEAYAAPLAEKRDRGHQKAFPQRHADRVAWWARIERRLGLSEEAALRRFSDVFRHLDDLAELYKNWYSEYTKTLVGYYFDKRLPESVKVLLFRIETVMQEIIGGYLHIKSDAHVARFYQRARLSWSVEPGPFHYQVEKGTWDELLAEMNLSAEMLTFETDSWSRSHWKGNGALSNVRASELCTRMVALVLRITSNCRDLQSILADEFMFGVLSDGCSQTAQLRRAQAAALKPFWEAANGMAAISRQLRKAIRDMEGTPMEGTPSAKQLLRLGPRWSYKRRQLLQDLNFFCVANWTRNTHRLSRRIVFQRPPRQAEPPLSPVIYTVPAGYPRGPSWNYNDYRGLNGEMVTLCYCREFATINPVLTALKHNGVIAIDVQRVADMGCGPGKRLFSPRHELSVVSLSTESHIAIFHLAQIGLDHADICSSLKILLENPRIIKVGVNIKEHQTRFEQCLGIHMTGTCDLASLDTALQVVSSAAPIKPQERSSLPMLVETHFGLVLPGPPSQADVWLHDLSLSCLRVAASASYACLRLFFYLSKRMLDLKHERPIPIDGCSDETVEALALLFPATATDSSRVSGDNIEAFTADEAQEAASSLAKIPYERTGPITIPGRSDHAERLALRWTQELVALAASGRPISKSHLPSLQLYCLWRTFRFGCDRIKKLKALHLQSRSNLPATILEVVERFSLPYHHDQYQDLQRMALLQFHTSQKLASLEDAFRGSTLQEWSWTDLHEHVTGLMTVIRGKIAAEDWIISAPGRAQAQLSQQSKRDLLPFAMWHISRITVDNISRLLLEPKYSIADSILEEVLRMKTPASFSKSALENLAQSTKNPLSWTNCLLTDAESAPREAHEPENVARNRTSIKKQDQSAQMPGSLPVVLTAARQLARGATKKPKTARSKAVEFPKRLDSSNDVRNRLTATKVPSKFLRLPQRVRGLMHGDDRRRRR